jgi:NAD(P)H dehydrogenase (quinone)
MHAHIVLTHPEPLSFNAHLADVSCRSLRAKGWTASVTDLYQSGFDPCERADHYPARKSAERFDVQAEQHHASAQGAIPTMVASEIQHLDQSDLLILQYPMWWHLPPAMLKGWMDRVFIYGGVYASTRRFEKGRFVGKRALVSVTVGTSADTYAFDGRSGDIDLLLWPVNFSLAYVGYTVLQPFVAYGVESGLRYSDDSVLRQRLEDVTQSLEASLSTIEDRPVIPYNRMEEWGADGRIKPSAPVHSPFIRRKQHLDFT